MMKFSTQLQKGFSLIAAIFLLAVLGAMMVILGMQQKKVLGSL